MHLKGDIKYKILVLIVTINLNVGLAICCISIFRCIFRNNTKYLMFYIYMGIFLLFLYRFLEYIKRIAKDG